jgi:hypothetical protein
VLTWAEPAVHWQSGFDSFAHHQRLTRTARLLARWPAAPFETHPTDCFRLDLDYWVWQPGIGGIQFNADSPAFSAFPDPNADVRWFERLITKSWMPAVYQVWGRQVLHASAVASATTRRVLVFTGPSGAGKSTLAYGLGRRRPWRTIADDTLAFSAEPGRLALHPLRNDTRLRSAAAQHYGLLSGSATEVEQPIEWPRGLLSFGRIFVLSGDPPRAGNVELRHLSPAVAYQRLLAQAHAFTLAIPEFNQRLMRDYLQLAGVPIVELRYRRSFDAMDDILDAIDGR